MSIFLLKTPKFWLKRGFIALILLPFSLIYLAGFRLVNFFRIQNTSLLFTICIGNLNVGGSGKTPVAIAIGKILQKLAIDFVYLSKGYKAEIRDFALVENKQEDFGENLGLKYGDEPLLLAEIAPSFISQDRSEGVKKIFDLYAQKKLPAVIVDDGLQNHSLKKDLKILVIDGTIGFGNGFLIPAGPLRQTIRSGIKMVDIIIIIDDQNGIITAKIKNLLINQQPTSLIIDANLVANNLDNFLNQKFVAFCGIAYPQKFFAFLAKKNLQVMAEKSFCDHKIYSNSELEELQDFAEKNQAKLITTKKDWVKFPKSWQEKISFLDVEIRFRNQEILINKIKNVIRAK
jgi:tetraacyldisaccharide 4'-kinase